MKMCCFVEQKYEANININKLNRCNQLNIYDEMIKRNTKMKVEKSTSNQNNNEVTMK